MDVKNHNMNKEKPIMRKRLKVIAFLAFFLGIVLAVFQYFGFVSKTVYEESVSHLTEVFHTKVFLILNTDYSTKTIRIDIYNISTLYCL